MKKSVLSCCLFLLVPGAMAEQVYSDPNPVTRSLVLQHEEAVVTAGAGYGESHNGESITTPLLAFTYGVTDDVTIGPLGVRYRFNAFDSGNQPNLELVAEGGLMGFYESEEFGDSFAVGAGFAGKYRLSSQLAFTFGAHYVSWIEDERDNRSEVRANGGMLYQVHPKLTLFAQAEYRELKDFAQDNAVNASVGGIWNVSRRSEVTFAVNYDDFEPAKDGYEDDSLAECMMVLSYTYRY